MIRTISGRLGIMLVACSAAIALCLSLGAHTAWASPAQLDSLSGYVAVSTLGKKEPVHAYYTKYKVSNVKSSNTSVVTAKAAANGKYLQVKLHKVGVSNVSMKINGKKKTLRFVVRKYVNPCSSFKIGAKNYKTMFNSSREIDTRGSHSSGALSIKPAKGWKLSWISRDGVKVRNGSKANSYASVYACFKNTRTGATENLFLM